MKTALIVGSGGQDGRLLFDQLDARGYAVAGCERTRVRSNRTEEGPPIDLSDLAQVTEAVRLYRPDELYYLAAYHHSAQDNALHNSGELFGRSYETHVLGFVNFLEAVRNESAATKIFYAGSSHLFGVPATEPQDETTPWSPTSIYGITKAAGAQTGRFYREQHGLFVSVGILYNHESEYRRPEFVTQKIVTGAWEIAQGQRTELALGDLSATVDWGYAPDYTDAMVRILQLPDSSEFVIATGEPHTVQDFVQITFDRLGLDWRQYVTERPGLLTKPRQRLIGDSSKLRRMAAWQPTITFAEMIAHLLDARRNPV